jgi:hypothetical protein
MPYRQALCPVCGKAGGKRVTKTVEGKPYIPLAWENTWKEEFDPTKPFGVIQETIGRGSFKVIGYFSPEDDPDGYFPLVKKRLIGAVRQWLGNGWLSKEEVLNIVESPLP